ncbi:DMT family transporter [Aestuariivirga sp.]|jgi:drug/metabolite transporter (DMT)-like permease|uniref:DMT family transporter n=1 Tax=Aestuariivirga sp. TaxID=2650926 RepID=UPI0037844D34
MQLTAILALIFTMIVWGVSPVFFRSLSLALGPADHLAIRYALVGALFLVVLAATRAWRIERADWPRMLLVSVIGFTGYNLGSAFGFELITAGTGSLIIGTQPLLIALIGILAAAERFTLTTGTGLLIGFSGIVFLVWNDLSLTGDPLQFLSGCAMIFVSGTCWAIYAVASKPLSRRYGSLQTTALSVVITSLVLVLLLGRPSTFDTLQAMSPRLWLEMGYLVVFVTALTMVTWNFGAARLPAVAAGAFLYLVPPIGVLAGTLILGERVTQGMVIGGSLILSGVAVTQFGDRITLKGKLAALAAILFAVTMWGLIPVAMRYLVTELSPQTTMVLRLLPSGLLALVVVLFTGVRQIAWRDWMQIAIASLVGNFGCQALIAYGMENVPASWTGLLFGLEPVFIALLAVLLAGERLTGWLIAGMLVAFAGTAALMLGSTLTPQGDVSLIGLGLLTLSTMCWGVYTVLIRPVSISYGPLPVACIAMALAALPTPLFVTADLPDMLVSMDATAWLAVAFVVVFGTFLATAAWNFSLDHMESSTAGLFLYMQPVVAALGGILLLGERITWPLILGGGLIIAGVAIAQFGPLMRRMRLRPAARGTRPPA